jgi:hypothetical protein
MADDIAVLTREEKVAFSALEKTIRDGLQTFYDVGRALQQIRDLKFYRQEHKSFDAYCENRWGIKSAHAKRLISSAEVVDNLKLISDSPGRTMAPNGSHSETASVDNSAPLPTNERQARALSKLDPEQQRAAWDKAVSAVGDPSKVTAAIVEQAVAQVVGKPEANGVQREPGEDREEDAIQDANGLDVPQIACPAFHAAKDIESVCHEIDDLKKRIQEKRGHEGWQSVIADSVLQALANARQALHQSRATHVCPYCKGTGKKRLDVCNCCKGRGWTIKATYNAAPDELKVKK